MQLPPRERWRRARPGAVFVALAAAAAGAAHAADFDETLKAPRMRSAAELQTQSRSVAERFATLRGEDARNVVSRADLVREQFDLKWKLTRAVDGHALTADSVALGAVADDGVLTIDLLAHPELGYAHDQIVRLMDREIWPGTSALLATRGFRDADLAALRRYADENSPRPAFTARAVPLTLAFARTVLKYDKAKRAVPDSLVESYLYQRALIDAETRRDWAQKLLGVLDAQRARIFLSVLGELPSTLQVLPGDFHASLADVLAGARLPDFEQRVLTEAKEPQP